MKIDYQSEIGGTIEMIDNEHEHSPKSVGDSRRIDTSPIVVSRIRVNNEVWYADPPLCYEVSFLPIDSCYFVEGDLGLSLHAFSRKELESALNESLESWWVNYAMAEDGNLSSGARNLKKQLLARFSTS
ncbi:MAG: hypothetical protein F4Z66_00585 [Gammaproteobacteria bacterium]|nr:hypothetical protein [Gammaproteobacteria bacterium]